MADLSKTNPNVNTKLPFWFTFRCTRKLGTQIEAYAKANEIDTSTAIRTLLRAGVAATEKSHSGKGAAARRDTTNEKVNRIVTR